MAELGILASITQIADIGLRLSIRLYAFGETVASADRSISAISNDISLTSSVLRELGNAMNRDKEKSYSKTGIKTAEAVARECSKVFQEMDSLLLKKVPQLHTMSSEGSSRATMMLERLRWPAIQSKVELMRSNLERTKSTLTLMLNVIIYAKQTAEKTESASVISQQKQMVEDLARATRDRMRDFDRIQSALLPAKRESMSRQDALVVTATRVANPSETSRQITEQSLQHPFDQDISITGGSDEVFAAQTLSDSPIELERLLLEYSKLRIKLFEEVYSTRYGIGTDARHRFKQYIMMAHGEQVSLTYDAHKSSSSIPGSDTSRRSEIPSEIPVVTEAGGAIRHRPGQVITWHGSKDIQYPRGIGPEESVESVRISNKKMKALFESDWDPSVATRTRSITSLSELLRGLAIYIIRDYEPYHGIVITPTKMIMFYENFNMDNEVYPWLTIFNDEQSSISRMYRDLECEHVLVQERSHKRPDIPGLTLNGFEQWMSLFIQAKPEVESKRLQKATHQLLVRSPESKEEYFSADFPQHLFPTEGNLKIRHRVEEAMIEHAGIDLSRSSSLSKAGPHDRSPPVRRGLLSDSPNDRTRFEVFEPETSSLSYPVPAQIDRERFPYSNIENPTVIDDMNTFEPQEIKPIERERKPYSASVGSGKLYDNLHDESVGERADASIDRSDDMVDFSDESDRAQSPNASKIEPTQTSFESPSGKFKIPETADELVVAWTKYDVLSSLGQVLGDETSKTEMRADMSMAANDAISRAHRALRGD